MTAFELLATAPQLPHIADHCRCTPTGGRRDVLLGLDAGSISVHCATCQLPIDVDPEELLADDIPMVMTTIVERVPADSFSGFEIGAVYHELTPVTEGADVQAFAEIVDHVRNIANAGGAS